MSCCSKWTLPMLALFAAIWNSASIARAEEAGPRKARVYIGTNERGSGNGIHVFDLDLKTGAAGKSRLVAELAGASFLAIHPDQQTLYAVGRLEDASGTPVAGSVVAYRIDAETGDLVRLNSQSTGGAGPCHVAVDPTGKSVVVANYGGGSVASFPLEKDGSLNPAATFVQHVGQSIHPRRQTAPHTHSATISADSRFAIVADLGIDKLLVYRLDPDQGTLTPHDPPFTETEPGGGPRHFAFHPRGSYAYSNDEISNRVTAYRYDAEAGRLTPLGSQSTLPEDFKTRSTTAECLVHPQGRFVYVSNRGHDSIAVFEVQADGTLTARGHIPSQGKTPRNFNFDPTGRWMLIANQDTGNVVVAEWDAETGMATPTGTELEISRPVCVKFLVVE